MVCAFKWSSPSILRPGTLPSQHYNNNGGGEGVVLNREITITNNLIYFLNLSSSILLSQSWLVQTSRANLPIGFTDWNFITTLFFQILYDGTFSKPYISNSVFE